MTPAKVALGELLFNARGLSVNGKLSCADCHHPANYFVDNVVTPTGALGDALPFNTPTLWNAAYSTSFSWVDKGFSTLAAQHMGPLTNSAPVELGTTASQLATLSQEPLIAASVAAAFPAAEALTLTRVAAALATYVRTLIRGETAFDAYVFNDVPNALGADARAGLQLFTSTRLNCASCHRGFLLSGPTRSVREAFPPSFYNTGVRSQARVDAQSDKQPSAFRAPSLRFVTHTAPYMHDGGMTSLDEVIDFYERGAVASAGAKARSRMPSFKLSAAERRELLAFLGSL